MQKIILLIFMASLGANSVHAMRKNKGFLSATTMCLQQRYHAGTGLSYLTKMLPAENLKPISALYESYNSSLGLASRFYSSYDFLDKLKSIVNRATGATQFRRNIEKKDVEIATLTIEIARLNIRVNDLNQWINKAKIQQSVHERQIEQHMSNLKRAHRALELSNIMKNNLSNVLTKAEDEVGRLIRGSNNAKSVGCPPGVDAKEKP